MRKIKQLEAMSYNSLKTAIDEWIENDLSPAKHIESFSMLYDAEGVSSSKYKAIMIVNTKAM